MSKRRNVSAKADTCISRRLPPQLPPKRGALNPISANNRSVQRDPALPAGGDTQVKPYRFTQLALFP